MRSEQREYDHNAVVQKRFNQTQKPHPLRQRSISKEDRSTREYSTKSYCEQPPNDVQSRWQNSTMSQL